MEGGGPGGQCVPPGHRDPLPQPAMPPTLDVHPDGLTLRGSLTRSDANYVHVDLDVPPDVARLAVTFTYGPTTPGRVGFGLFEPPADTAATTFRGWSDHWRSNVEVGETTATPGYLPGPITPGPWTIVLAPFGLDERGADWEVTVRFHHEQGGETPQPRWAPESVQTGPGWYRGDLHVHSEYSADAPPGSSNFAPADLVARARAAGLDFFASTDHNTHASHAVWGSHATSDLLVLNGEEVTFRDGHLGAIGLDAGTWIDFRATTDAEVATRIAAIRAAGGLAIMNHPVENGCPDCDWRFSIDHDVDAIEVWTNVWSDDNEARVAFWAQQLAAGRRIPAVGGSDSHRPPDVVGRPQVVVQAEHLSRVSVLDGIRSGRAYLAAARHLALEFACTTDADGAGRATIGDRIVAPTDGALTASARIDGVDQAIVSLHGRDEVVATERLSRAGAPRSWDVDAGVTGGLLRIEVRDPDGRMLLLSNPIWVEGPA